MSTTRHTIRIAAPPTDVYHALLDSQLIPQWRVPAGMRCEIHRFDPREGGAFRVSLTYHSTSPVGKSSAHTDTYSGHFEQLVPGQRVVERLAFETTDPQMQGDMRITTELLADGDGTRVTVVHEGLPAGVAPADNEAGWQESLSRLAALFDATTLI
jgi:uncharacterized protein YndB with AHSA1/START domain